jgi:hypothetical protein
MTTDTTLSPRAAALTRLVDFLIADAAERHESAPAVAEQLMDLARQVERVSTLAGGRPAFSAGQLAEIKANTRTLYNVALAAMKADARWSLPGISVADRKRWGLGAHVAELIVDDDKILTVRSMVPGALTIGRVATNLQAEQLMLAFAWACEIVLDRMARLTPPPAAPARPNNRRQLVQQMTDQAQSLARRLAA